MNKSSQFDLKFYDEKAWGASEIDSHRKGIDLLKLQRLVEAEHSWKGKSCLEVGCGTGRYLRGLSRLRAGENVHFVGTDISRTSLDIAKSAGGGVEYLPMDPDKIPWPDQTFDIVCFLDVLEHVENPLVFLKESVRVLKVGGILHASVPLEGDIRSMWRWFDFIRLHDRTKRMDGQIQRFTYRGLKSLFADCGLKFESEYYSYHVIGNVLDLTLFTWLNMRRSLGFRGSHYDIIQSSRSGKKTPFSFLATLAEAAMYWEGRVLGRVIGPNAHITYRRIL